MMFCNFATFAIALLFGVAPGLHAENVAAPVEARVPFAPSMFVGSDGAAHLAYELHVTNFYGDTGPLIPKQLEISSDTSRSPLLVLDKGQLRVQVRPAPAEGETLAIPAGKRLVIFIWITLAAGDPVPRQLTHKIDFETDKQTIVSLDGAPVRVSDQKPMTLAPPVRGGQWLAHEGPGFAQSHHWGSLVAVNGDLTIPQRFALDLVGVDQSGKALRDGTKDLQRTHHTDWIGYGWDVLAVADGIVRRTRNDAPEHPPLSPQPEPAALTADALFGNHVVLELAPGVFASYAHLKKGSVQVHPGERVRRGQLLARLGQSGNSAAPHLHFQLSNAATFEGSEGIPYVFNAFDLLGPETEAQLFGQGGTWTHPPATARRLQLPLNDVVIRFPDR